MSLFTRAIAGALLILAGTPAAMAQPGRDWSTVATRNPDGAFVQGNPAAPVKLVEYLSLTCPHCAKFEKEGVAPLTAKYVRTGQVSYEVRHALRDAFDFAATLLARCNGPQAFFAITPIVYAQQDQWFARAAEWSQTAPDSKGMPVEKMLPMVADGSGLSELFAEQGVPEAKGNACVADVAEHKVLVTMAEGAWKRPGFPGTPAFAVDGSEPEVYGTWADLDRKLAAVIASKSGPRPAQKRR